MKLRNKKTGEIDNWCIDKDVIRTCSGSIIYNSLAELNEEWEDYEEPKRTWFIDTNCVPNYIDYGDNPITDHCYDDWNELGICFETKEEAEKAVEKLKAWKRLKELDTEILGWEIRDISTSGNWQTVNVKLNIKARKEPMGLLGLLFGGEE